MWVTRATGHKCGSDDLPRIGDAIGICGPRPRHIDLGEAAAGVEKAVLARVVAKEPDDLSRAVDAIGICGTRPGHVDLGEAAAGVEKAVLARVVDKEPDILRGS